MPSRSPISQEQNPHPFLDLLRQHRDATKIRQIVETLEKGIGSDGRIHTTYEQTGAATGRLSSNDPNLQNIPIKTEVGREVRSAFVAGEGFETLLTADYSQIEMRIMAHLSGDEGLIEAFHSGEDLHRFVGARVFGVDPADVTPTMRTKVKAMSYGLAYGLSPFGLSKQLRIETSEAKELIADYFARFGGIRDYLRGVVLQAKEDGYTTTIFGRRRPFTDLDLVEPGPARERRAPGAQLADPGLGRRHHQARDAGHRRRHPGSRARIADADAGARRARARGRAGGGRRTHLDRSRPDVGRGRAERPARRAGRRAARTGTKPRTDVTSRCALA